MANCKHKIKNNRNIEEGWSQVVRGGREREEKN